MFHWVNAADSWSFGTAHRVGYEGKSFKAGVGVEYNQSRRTARTDGARKDASDWRLTAGYRSIFRMNPSLPRSSAPKPAGMRA